MWLTRPVLLTGVTGDENGATWGVERPVPSRSVAGESHSLNLSSRRWELRLSMEGPSFVPQWGVDIEQLRAGMRGPWVFLSGNSFSPAV